MTQLELRQLPLTFDELISQADSSGWAVVQSESWFLTRTLYAGPSSTAAMLGEYFPAAPARILEDRGEWLHVSIWGREGWMQRGSLAFGLDMLDVFLRTGDEISLFTHEPVPLYASMEDDAPALLLQPGDQLLDEMCIFGLIGDDWLHAATYNGCAAGYVPREFLNPGSG